MNYIRHKTILSCIAAAALLSACTTDDMPAMDEGATVYPTLHFGVSEMETVTRAIAPMTVEEEKYITTLAIFEFDNEGLHIRGANTYHFIDFIKGTVDGHEDPNDDIIDADHGVVEFTLKGISFESYSNGTICLVANITETQVTEFYDQYREEGQTFGRMTFEKFKEWSLPFEYKQAPDPTVYDESVAGHLKQMYMFGYYQGKIDASDPEAIWIDLGRLASRLDITVRNETGEDISERLGYHFDEVCRSAYFFPIKTRRPPVFETGLTRTVIASGSADPIEGVDVTFPANDVHTRYFYAAAHSAKNAQEATKLHLYYGAPMLANDEPGPGGVDVEIPMCNIHPALAAEIKNGYSLSRNTRYHFTIRLKKRTSMAKSKPDFSYEAPGEIVVYLP